MQDLAGKVALVTGSGRGLGEGIALEMARLGMDLIINDTIEENANAVAEKIRAIDREAFVCHGDISDSEFITAMVKKAFEKYGRIDVLVNNAGISPKKEGGKIPFYEIPDDQWNTVLAVNLTGSFMCLREVSKSMMENRSGSVINITSISAKSGNSGPGGAHYSASKAGLDCLTKAAARELASFNIRVNAVAPGVIATPMRDLSSPEVNEALMQKIPLGRFGRIEEVVAAVVFLASDASSYITGATLDLNGGMLML